MANKRVKADSSKFKDIKQGVTPQKEQLLKGAKKHQGRLWKVLNKDFFDQTKWDVAHLCLSKEHAEKWIEKAMRGYGRFGKNNYVIVGPEDSLESAPPLSLSL